MSLSILAVDDSKTMRDMIAVPMRFGDQLTTET